MKRPTTCSAPKRITLAASALVLALGLGGLPPQAPAQDRVPSQDQSSAPTAAPQPPAPPPDQAATPEQAPPPDQAAPQNQAPPPPPEQAPPPPGPYGQPPPPYGGYPQQGPPGYGYPQGLPPRYPQAQPYVPPPELPATLTLPAGTMIPVRINDFLSSDASRAGQMFTATLDQPLLANSWIVARRGALVTGQVSVAKKAERGKNDSQLGVVLAEVTLVDGQQVPVTTELVQTAAGGSPYDTNRKVGTVAGSAALGTVIGGIAGGGLGAAIGAGLGATTGGAIVLSTHGRPTILPREALLTFKLDQPITITTTGNETSFRLAGPSDFGPDQDAYGRYGAPGYGPGYGGPGYGPGYGPSYPPAYPGYGYPPPPAYYYGAYPYAWGYPYYPFYAYPYFGIGFGGYWGPRYYGRPFFRR